MLKKLRDKLFKKKELTVDDALSGKINPWKEYHKHLVKQEIFILGMILIALGILGVIGSYTGFVAYHAGQAGYIYDMNIQFKQPEYNWAAVYGAAFGVGFDQPWAFDIDPGSMNEENVFFQCFENGITHEVYASTVPFDQLDMNNLAPATYADINAITGALSNDYDSAENTFLNYTSVEYGSTLINNIHSTYTYVGNGTNRTAFDVGVMKDSNGNIILVSHVSGTLVKGFNDRYYGYQMLVPIIGNSTTKYYMFSDPNDVCIGGSENPQIKGIVQGTVTDSSGNPLEGTLVVVGSHSSATDVNGFYNFTAEVGNEKIIAIKEGYKVYENDINVTENNITEHNIVMELETIPNQFTNIGPDFSSGVDAPGDNVNVGPGQVPVQVESPQVIEGQDFVILISEIKKKMKLGEFSQQTVTLKSYKKTTMDINIEVTGNVSNLTSIDKTKLSIPSKSDGTFTVTFFANTTPGIYNGTIKISGGVDAIIPVTIEILSKDKIPIQALLISLNAPQKSLYAGSTFTFRTDLTNLLNDQQYPVQLLYTIQSLDGKNTIWAYRTNVFLKTSLSIVKNVELPTDASTGDYVLRVTANYMDLSSSASYVFPIELSFFETILLGKIRVWHALLILAGLISLITAFILVKRNIEAKKKYHLRVEMSEIPKEGARSIKVGKIAETNHKAYMNIENFKTHTIVAGSTGGGKSFSAQVIIEEMLLKNVAVIVFDPTAQWTGMLRKLENKGLLALYPNYDMKPKDAQAFKGNIRQIDNPRELIDIRDYLKPGEIQVFACHKLDPKDIDIFIANTVRQVFRANFEESEPLKLMLVYDEVHRLLPKFGGSGEGFLQIERACREFRKWGIGVMLISQVLADFVGQIKANINTEVQMRTRDEGDLDRIKTKFGQEVLQSLVKASVGTGMVQNSAYNRGKPYFITFRPIMHSVTRLTDDEIQKYNVFNEKIDQIAYELTQLEELKQDVFDIKLELKLALDKVKAGNFNMAQIYTEGLEPRIKKFWEKLNKTPKKLERKTVSEAELKAELDKAKEDRSKFEKENKKEEPGEEKKAADPVANFKKDVPPNKILKLHNDMLVVTPTSLFSEIQAMKDADFEFQVNEDKNDFADWITDAVGDKELGDLLAQETDKKAILDLLDMREKGKKLPKLVIKKQPKEKEETETENSEEAKKKSSEKKDKEKEEKEKEEAKEQKPSPEEEKKAFKKMAEDPEEVKEASEKKDKAKEKPAEEKPDEWLQDKVEDVKKEPASEKKKEYLLKETSPDKYFKLENGKELKSVKDLIDYLPKMPEEIFKHHVTNDKNDFANWIKFVFNEESLAKKVFNTKSKDSLEEVLMNG